MAKKPRKRASKGGRPRKKGDRYPSGKLRPSGPTAELLAHRVAAVGERNGMAPDAGWLIGALFLAGSLHPAKPSGPGADQDIARARRDAGERFVDLSAQMHRLVQAPGTPQAVDPLRSGGRSGEDNPVHYARVRAEYDASLTALQSAGNLAMMAVIRAARDEWAPVSYIPPGLDALACAHEAIKRAGRRAAEAARENHGMVA